MNMAMVTPQMGAAATPAANAGSQASGKSAGADSNGFAGALVQALGGESKGSTGAAANAALLMADVGSLLGQAQTQQDDAATGTDLAAMLNQLAAQLQTMAQAQDDSASNDTAQANDPIAQLLASLQELLNQLNLLQPASTINADASGLTSAASELTAAGGGQTASLATLMPVLLQALKQASQNGQLDQLSQPVQDFVNKLQQATANGDTQGANALAIGKAAETTPASQTTANPLQMQEMSDQQPVLVVASAEPRKATSAFKEPIVYWHLAGNTAASDQTEDVPVVTATGGAQQSSDQPMPFGLALTQQSQPQPTANAGQATLPAQVPVQQFTEQVGNYLVKQFTLSGGNGMATAKLTLHPDHLGQVDIRIVMQDGQMTAQFVAHNGTAKDLLENQMGLLRTALQGQGIQVEKMDVVQQSDLTSQTAFFGQEQRDSDPGRGRGQASKRELDGGYEEPVDFEAEMERSSVLREAGYGSSINVTA